MAKKHISPRVQETTGTFLTTIFRSKNAGAEYTIESFQPLYRRTLVEVSGMFTAGELSLMIDVFNSTMLTAAIAGQHLQMNCVDGMELDHLDEKWEVDRKEFTEKLSRLTIYQAHCLELWANGFWYSEQSEDGRDLKKYVAILAQK